MTSDRRLAKITGAVFRSLYCHST